MLRNNLMTYLIMTSQAHQVWWSATKLPEMFVDRSKVRWIHYDWSINTKAYPRIKFERVQIRRGKQRNRFFPPSLYPTIYRKFAIWVLEPPCSPTSPARCRDTACSCRPCTSAQRLHQSSKRVKAQPASFVSLRCSHSKSYQLSFWRNAGHIEV